MESKSVIALTKIVDVMWFIAGIIWLGCFVSVVNNLDLVVVIVYLLGIAAYFVAGIDKVYEDWRKSKEW